MTRWTKPPSSCPRSPSRSCRLWVEPAVAGRGEAKAGEVLLGQPRSLWILEAATPGEDVDSDEDDVGETAFLAPPACSPSMVHGMAGQAGGAAQSIPAVMQCLLHRAAMCTWANGWLVVRPLRVRSLDASLCARAQRAMVLVE